MNKTYNNSSEPLKPSAQSTSQTQLRSCPIPNIYQHQPQSHSKHRSISPLISPPLNQVDELKDNLLKVKDNFNKKTKEIRDLKLVFNRLNQDHCSNVRLIDTILKEANRAQEKPITDIREQIIQGDFTQKNISKLKETHHTLILKRQNQEIKAQIEQSVKKLEDLKEKTKTVHLNELENGLKIKNDHIEALTIENETLKEQVDLLEKRVLDSNKSIEASKANATQLKTQHQDLVAKLNKQSEQNEQLKKTRTVYEERTSNQKFCIANLKQQLAHNDELLKQHDKTKKSVDQYIKDKPALDNAEEEKSAKLKKLTSELQSLNDKSKQIEAVNAALVEKIEVYEKERARSLPNIKELSSAYKEKDRKIKQLEEKLKKEISDKEAFDNELNEKMSLLEEEEEKMMADIDRLNQKMAKGNQDNAVLEGELQEVELRIQEYIKKGERDMTEIEVLNCRITKAQSGQSGEGGNEDNKETPVPKDNDKEDDVNDDIKAKKEIEELDEKIKAAEEALLSETVKQKESEEVIRKLNIELESNNDIDELNNEIEVIKKEIKDLRKAKA